MTVPRNAGPPSNRVGNSVLPQVRSLVAASVLVMTLVAPVLASTADPTAVQGSIAPISDAGRSAKADGRANVARSLSDDKIAPDVQEALERYGKADVVIALVQPPEMAEMQTDLEALRTEVARLQQAVLAELDADEFVLRVAYQAVPALAGRLLDEKALAILEAHPGVAKVDLDVGGAGGLDVSVPLIHADQRHALGNRGAGVLVAVLDSGADTDHPDLADDIAGQACFGDWDGSINGVGFCPGGSDRRTGLGSAEDDAGHGTHVTGIITSRGTVSAPGVAPDANILAIKVTDNCSYSGCFYFFSEIVAALDYIINSQPQVKVINMSLATSAQFAGDCDNSTSWNMAGAAAINTLRANGVTAFASSGNNGSGTTMGSPACLSSVISVGATDDSDAVASFTSTSSTTDIMAPGVGIVALAIGGGALSASGTSMASPHAAGCAALLIEAGTATTPSQIETRLETSSIQVTDPTNGRTYPRIDCSPSSPMAVSLAAFNAQAQVDHVLVSWETSSEINNQGFKIWRGPSNTAPQTVLGFVPSQAPGSGQGFSYAYQDLAVTPGQTTWYWLETIDVNGITELHGPISAILQSPTNVALNDFGANSAPNGNSPGWFVAAGAAMLGALAGIRRRLHRQPGA